MLMSTIEQSAAITPVPGQHRNLQKLEPIENSHLPQDLRGIRIFLPFQLSCSSCQSLHARHPRYHPQQIHCKHWLHRFPLNLHRVQDHLGHRTLQVRVNLLRREVKIAVGMAKSCRRWRFCSYTDGYVDSQPQTHIPPKQSSYGSNWSQDSRYHVGA